MADNQVKQPADFLPFDGSEGVILVTAVRREMTLDDDEILIANLTPLFLNQKLPDRNNTRSYLIDFNSDRIKACLEQPTPVAVQFVTDYVEQLWRGEIDALEFRNVPGMTFGTFVKEIPTKGGYIQWHRRHLDKLIRHIEQVFAVSA